jgi:hypothetical protein
MPTKSPSLHSGCLNNQKRARFVLIHNLGRSRFIKNPRFTAWCSEQRTYVRIHCPILVQISGFWDLLCNPSFLKNSQRPTVRDIENRLPGRCEPPSFLCNQGRHNVDEALAFDHRGKDRLARRRPGQIWNSCANCKSSRSARTPGEDRSGPLCVSGIFPKL